MGLPGASMKTPVVLFIFNRPATTARVFAAIAAAKPKHLLIVADGPRPGIAGDAAKVEATRALVSQIDWDCTVLRNYAEQNMGLAQRVPSGLDWAFSHYERAIVLEDDCLPHPTFFRYCDELLDRYQSDASVGMIGGSNFQNGASRTDASYYFSRYPVIWGWATWRDRWVGVYDPTMARWPALRNTDWLAGVLDGDRRKAAYWRDRFDETPAIDSWAYRWLFANWVAGRLCITPDVNLVANVGFGADATHTTQDTSPVADVALAALRFPLRHPDAVVALREADLFSGNAYYYAGMPPLKSWARRTLITTLGYHRYKGVVSSVRGAVRRTKRAFGAVAPHA